MDEQQRLFHFPLMGNVSRRNFLKMGAALGISAAALDSMFFSSQAAHAATPGLAGYWPLDNGSGTSATDTSGGNHNGVLNGNPTWTTGKNGTALSFNGSNTTVDINHNVVDTSSSFSVAAWVQLASLNNWATAVSQDGSNVSGFFLQYTSPAAGSEGGKFAFSLVNADATTGTSVRATSPFSPIVNTWYHLVGVYDAANHQSRLYVNGALVGTQTVSSAWNATGETVIGRAKFGGSVDYWSGLIDDVQISRQALSDADVRTLYQTVPALTPLRPPSVPLIVRNPYVSTWQNSDVAPGSWSTFWNGNVKAITGIVRVDGTSYVFFGAPGSIGTVQTATQIQLEITATQSRYVFQAGAVNLYVNFLSPIEATNVQLLSIPFGYIYVQAHSNDGKTHTVSVYMDISGEWAHGTNTTPINWAYQTINTGTQNVNAFSVTPNVPQILAETNDYPSWGSAIWATNGPGFTYQSGQDSVVRSQAVSQGNLSNTMDTGMPRAINDRWPVFGFNFNLGTLSGTPNAPIVFVLGHVRQPAVSYQGGQISPLWQSYWSNWSQMLGAAYNDATALAVLARANTLDASIARAAVAAGGAHYAALCALAARQAFGGIELVNTSSAPWLFLKEISSDGNVSTIDVIYPMFPILYYLSPNLLSLILAPILHYVESGLWPRPYCVHDLGSSYPNASGHNDGGGENMQVEETANMLIMAAAYILQASASDASTYSNAHYTIFKQWADYLNAPNGGNPSRPNALDPLLQNQTDDFTGLIAHSTNLALKGILGIGAMGIIAHAAGKSSDQQFYSNTAATLITQWAQLGQDSSQAHLDIAYTEADTDQGTGAGTYSLKYNAFPDRTLGLNLIPTSVLQEEANWYLQKKNQYGIPLDTRHTYTKSDWELWTAASTDNIQLRQFLIDALYSFANTSPSRVPFTDWYDTISNTQNGFQARPVVGGLFSLLARIKSGH
ncbi:glutaminase domain-containing protein [Dictyobacter arantiisoli]|uniref:LamG-like jellyroll fold domain-containing protein n=1 Tax=Dictyobacter arantiisoli TaxID=2014874 RepID=A0A5A5T6M3_9CHLR|nr:DUF5127 domain-containing protein [Dictyobacter arantiisoli]GCF07121.1 hypothetical protein KDI_06850 [Dictyobacter arantiisoli]